MSTKVISLEETRKLIKPSSFEDSNLTKDSLLQHYVQEGVQVLQGLDNLGNFLMGFGVLMLGYLLNVDLKIHYQKVFYSEHWYSFSSLALFAWAMAILLLFGFMYLFIFHLIAGRSVYASRNDKQNVGKRIHIKKMTYEQFEQTAPDFKSFIAVNYLEHDRRSDPQLWYATFRYTRFMACRKLMVMNRMRELLAGAMVHGIIYKMVDIAVTIV